MRNSRLPRCLLLLAATALLGACSVQPVKPWERARLARWDMRWDADGAQAALDEHAYFSKEGTTGRVGAAGGGCGCN